LERRQEQRRAAYIGLLTATITGTGTRTGSLRCALVVLFLGRTAGRPRSHTTIYRQWWSAGDTPFLVFKRASKYRLTAKNKEITHTRAELGEGSAVRARAQPAPAAYSYLPMLIYTAPMYSSNSPTQQHSIRGARVVWRLPRPSFAPVSAALPPIRHEIPSTCCGWRCAAAFFRRSRVRCAD
jgi:hypothetical protein